jgi:hypothetical protein
MALQYFISGLGGRLSGSDHSDERDRVLLPIPWRYAGHSGRRRLLLALGVACYALYVRRLNGMWRRAFVITAVLSLYLNVFVLVVQTFQKNPALVEIAPEQTGPAFAVTQATVLGVFVWLGLIAVRRFRADPRQQN